MRPAELHILNASAACGLRRLKSGYYRRAHACTLIVIITGRARRWGRTEIVGCSAGWPWGALPPAISPRKSPSVRAGGRPHGRGHRAASSVSSFPAFVPRSTSARTARSISAAVTSPYVLCCAMTGRSARPRRSSSKADRAEALFHSESLDDALRDLGCFGEGRGQGRGHLCHLHALERGDSSIGCVACCVADVNQRGGVSTPSWESSRPPRSAHSLARGRLQCVCKVQSRRPAFAF